MSLLKLFYHVDDFCHVFELTWKQQLLASQAKQRDRAAAGSERNHDDSDLVSLFRSSELQDLSP